VHQRSVLAPWLIAAGGLLAIVSLLFPWLVFNEDQFWDAIHTVTGIPGVGRPELPPLQEPEDRAVMQQAIEEALAQLHGNLRGYQQTWWAVASIAVGGLAALTSSMTLRSGSAARGAVLALSALGVAIPGGLRLLADPSALHGPFTLTAWPWAPVAGGALIAAGAFLSGAWESARGIEPAAAAPSTAYRPTPAAVQAAQNAATQHSAPPPSMAPPAGPQR
jgi:hypothetical protein